MRFARNVSVARRPSKELPQRFVNDANGPNDPRFKTVFGQILTEILNIAINVSIYEKKAVLGQPSIAIYELLRSECVKIATKIQ